MSAGPPFTDMAEPDGSGPILSVKNLQAHFRTTHFGVNRHVRAVDGITSSERTWCQRL